MSYTRDEVRFLIAHQGDISDAEQGLQMNKKHPHCGHGGVTWSFR